ncbi:HNH endonuclease [Stenotrophomonas bentonitica]|uniref:HNH endonuclease n=1 Tax=Stenotrophomonas bentonitica TaxID=1450134 RepID=UPI0031BAF435
MLELAPFLDAIARADAPLEGKANGWQRNAVLAEFGNTCAFCSDPLDLSSPKSWTATSLVPAQLGGPSSVVENLVPSCRSCASRKGLRDVVSWSDWQAKADPDRVSLLLERRRGALLYAENHFTPLSRHSKRERLLAHLSARFDNPRFRVYAWSGVVDGGRVCLVGWSTRSGDALALSEALLALRLRDGAEVLAEGRTCLLRVPAGGFLGAVWKLIEAHGIVVPLDVPGDGPVDVDDWRECWRNLVIDPVSNHKRIPIAGVLALPHAPRVLSTNPDSVRRLAQLQVARREDRKAEAELRYREAVARKANYLERVKRGIEAPVPLDDFRAWADEVRHLGVEWAELCREAKTKKHMDYSEGIALSASGSHSPRLSLTQRNASLTNYNICLVVERSSGMPSQ